MAICPSGAFSAKTAAFLAPIAAAIWAVYRWHGAKLSGKTDRLFREFLLTSLREGTFDEAVRILLRNADRLGDALSEETAGLLFDRRFVRALVAARSWVHLDLLTHESLLKKLPNRSAAVDCTMRELLSAEESPLRTSVLWTEGGDETATCSDDEDQLIGKTLLNAKWYLACRPGYPLLMAACEFLDSGKADRSYNRNDTLYIAQQGVSSRSRCPLFLAEKTIVNGVKAAIEEGVDGDFYVTDLSELFELIYERSVYDPRVWDAPQWLPCSEYPTPFAYMLSTNSYDLRDLSIQAFRKSHGGRLAPGEVARQLGVAWAACLMYVAGDTDPPHVSDDFRLQLVKSHFSFVLEHLHPVQETTDSPPEHLRAWQENFLAPIREMLGPSDQAAQRFLAEAANHLDLGRPNIFDHEAWFRGELGLPPRPEPSR
jgi:hypothetical protein